jgi:hypothetical protein
MVENGSTAVRVPSPLLYYRQHSVSQANTMLNALIEVKHLRKLNSNLMHVNSILEANQTNQELTKTNQELTKTNQELNQNLILIRNSTIWRATRPVRDSIEMIKKFLKP